MFRATKLSCSVALALISFCAPTTQASAADLVDAPAAAPGYNWSGLYLGIGGGAGAGVYQIEVPPLGGLDLAFTRSRFLRLAVSTSMASVPKAFLVN